MPGKSSRSKVVSIRLPKEWVEIIRIKKNGSQSVGDYIKKILLEREQIRDLVKRYALACNALLELKDKNLINLYEQLCRLYLAGQSDIVMEVTKELLSTDELPEPVRTFWRDHLPRQE